MKLTVMLGGYIQTKRSFCGNQSRCVRVSNLKKGPSLHTDFSTEPFGLFQGMQGVRCVCRQSHRKVDKPVAPWMTLQKLRQVVGNTAVHSPLGVAPFRVLQTKR